MYAIYWLISTIINLYVLALFIWVVLSWLLMFNVVNTGNQIVRSLFIGLSNLIEPALRPIRKFLPDLGGLDLSPIVLFIGLQFVNILLADLFGLR